MFEVFREGLARVKLFHHLLTHDLGPDPIKTVKGTVGEIGQTANGETSLEIFTRYVSPDNFDSTIFSFPSQYARRGLSAIQTGDHIITSNQRGAPIFTIQAAPRE